MFVKICGITNEEDALMAVALGADALGFVFATSSRQITPGAAADIIKRLPPDVLSVGVFRDQAPDRVIDVALRVGCRGVQLHGHETPGMADRIRPHVPVLIVGMSAGSSALEHFDRFGADALLLDGHSPGSGQVFDWSLTEGMPSNRRVILAGGLTPDNVADGVSIVRPWGVDVSTGVESQPGVKDPRLVRSFIHAARDAEDPVRRAEGPGPFDWDMD
ncbi:MAG: phosphoribosylanthranilate isomerase [Candidatus Microthrix parvicella]|uniref:phosphoribosylanthranilate isomerase n=1 Tax=Candidatus Neomicrothrix parvicella TaxID=41950 RepID=UPI0004AD0767|nr:phosphoribosylanthranilate isomerase [Candidatus Microthrix parvicella]NLH67240.1 phosphoribosylanthranilate isomerase [Candidatus Microthrix parvicella]